MVIDGVPMDGNSVKGSSNPMSLVSPENVENMTILKGPSATAIYGSRASNGVIIITTKSGKSGRPQVNFAANFLCGHPRNYLNMMNASEFASFIRNRYGEDSMQAAQLGTANTNWQKEVLRTTFSHDYSLSVGGTAGVLPYRVAVNYTAPTVWYARQTTASGSQREPDTQVLRRPAERERQRKGLVHHQRIQRQRRPWFGRRLQPHPARVHPERIQQLHHLYQSAA